MGEALQIVVAGTCDRQPFRGIRDVLLHAPVLPLGGAALSRASESITFLRLRYCDTSTRPKSTVSSTPRIFAAASAAFSGSKTTTLATPEGSCKLERISMPAQFEPMTGQAITGFGVAASTKAESALLRPAMVM